MTQSHVQLVDAYDHGAERLRQAIVGLIDADMTKPTEPGKWSIQQLVIHVSDSELVMADRMKRIIAEDNPPLLAFDESRWISQLHCDRQSAHDAAALAALVRHQMTRILRALPDAAFDRTGVHTQRGPLPLHQVIKSAIDHLEHHLKFLNGKRETLGKLMW